MTVTVIGAGLAGIEAAHTLSRNGIKVRLHEMKPHKYSPAHQYAGFAELVCSNSLKADRLSTAGGLLKAEMRILGSLSLEAAELTKVPAGGALAVDRTAFSDEITRQIQSDPNIEVITEEVTDFPEKNAIIATGPLTSDAFADSIADFLSEFGASAQKSRWLSFYDAAAPIITAESVNMEKAFLAARYGKGGDDYINCPFTKEEYEAFYHALIAAETAPLHDFDVHSPEKAAYYEGCMPVEVLAKRGQDALRFGCMKPVGLTDPRTGKRPYANLQLRKENAGGTMYNIVGFQTNLKFGEQKRVFSLIPGCENAEFVRYGVMHRNTFLDSPRLLDNHFMLRGSENICFAGQITGVEGYMESAASGIISALSFIKKFSLPRTSIIGALTHYISDESVVNFQPMGANMGLLPRLDEIIKGKQERYEKLAERAIKDLQSAIQ
ncbi:MAG: methylenetetrahydrofolate--tRNA-(uracil(54)-C(5))-methyltransferase (FADH(2)-oxidizing) TrmFO [Oscillospiraceae bacterium]|nr:methylenetetrahydrofolate--tRNA-(uracil(54)-C(5))-methyltransferase (FADH(2)-oxidizing) TrmFO [Oscillospiraceae bacterium]